MRTNALRQAMLDAHILSITQLAILSGLSRQTIYNLMRGKSPSFDTFNRLMTVLNLNDTQLRAILFS